jgi:hypothetical protein
LLLIEIEIHIYDEYSWGRGYLTIYPRIDLKKVEILMRPLTNILKDVFEIYLIFLLSIYFFLSFVNRYGISNCYSLIFDINNQNYPDSDDYFQKISD